MLNGSVTNVFNPKASHWSNSNHNHFTIISFSSRSVIPFYLFLVVHANKTETFVLEMYFEMFATCNSVDKINEKKTKQSSTCFIEQMEDTP